MDKTIANYKSIANSGQFEILFSTLPNFLMVLNQERQIVFCNNSLLKYINIDNTYEILGERPGEVINCVHAHLEEGGCGTSEFCSACGALKAILEAQEGKNTNHECRILINANNHSEALDFRVYAAQAQINDTLYTIVHFVDISDEKRRTVLEKIFFHDLSNTASNIYGISEILAGTNNLNRSEQYHKFLQKTAKKLINEIKEQKDLLAAEKDELIIQKKKISSLNLLRDLSDEYSSDEFNGNIIIDSNTPDIEFSTDPTIIGRVIGNLIKNALEASNPEEIISIGARANNNTISFWVNNHSYIEPQVRKQIFQRSFSTKGNNRGLGTYSVKFLTEKYLSGRVSFITSSLEGTTFTIELPLEI